MPKRVRMIVAMVLTRTLCTPPAGGASVSPGYPAPPVDHAEGRARALAPFKRHAQQRSSQCPARYLLSSRSFLITFTISAAGIA